MNELEQRILEILENQNVGMTRAAIESALKPSSKLENSQQVVRALRALAESGRVRFEGATRARRYLPTGGADTPPTGEVALSPEAVEALSLISQPLTMRAAVSYRRDFLDRAGQGLLPREVRARLRALGQTAAANQPAGTWARRELERFLLDLSWNSARLEGNTYSLLDTERLFKEARGADGKNVVETQMLLNHKAAIEFIVAEPMTADVDERTIKALHSLLMENLLGNALDEGRLRVTPVQIGGSTYLPLANPQLLDECFRQLVLTARQLDDPFECALFTLMQLPYLQPFLDGNKRTARLVANLPFVRHNLVPLSFVDVPRELLQKAYLAVYEFNRPEPLRDLFCWAYERSVARLGQVRASLGEPDPFRLEHRKVLRRAVHSAVQQLISPAHQRDFFAALAREQLAPALWPRFIATAELELESLHEGTFARYSLRPSEYEAWVAARGSR